MSGGSRIFVREHGILTRLGCFRFNAKPIEGDIIRDYDEEVLIEIRNGEEFIIARNYKRPEKIISLKEKNRKKRPSS